MSIEKEVRQGHRPSWDKNNKLDSLKTSLKGFKFWLKVGYNGYGETPQIKIIHLNQNLTLIVSDRFKKCRLKIDWPATDWFKKMQHCKVSVVDEKLLGYRGRSTN